MTYRDLENYFIENKKIFQACNKRFNIMRISKSVEEFDPLITQELDGDNLALDLPAEESLPKSPVNALVSSSGGINKHKSSATKKWAYV